MASRAYERLGTHGAASSTHHLATATAMAVLARGGNAFDAVVAGGFVLQVVEPHMCGPGGEVVAVFVTASDPSPRALCGQGVVPGRATAAHLRDELGLTAVPGTGLLAATVPGAWDGWLTLLRDHGTLPLADVLAPALGYADAGFPLAPRVPPTIRAVASHFRAHWPGSAATWLRSDGAVPSGSHRLPALAATWRKLLAAAVGPTRETQIDAARAAWSRGFVAEEIARFVTAPVRDDSGRDHAGLITADDLTAWHATYEDAVVADVGGGWGVAKLGPWSQGPVLAQTLQLLRDRDLAYVDGVATEPTVHVVTEAAKLAFADREAWYGDSAPVPLAELLAPDYNEARARMITDSASSDLRPGAPGGRAPRLPAFTVTPPGELRGDGLTPAGLGEPTVATDDRAPATVEGPALDRGIGATTSEGRIAPPVERSAGDGSSRRAAEDRGIGGAPDVGGGASAGEASASGPRSGGVEGAGGAGEPTVRRDGLVRGDTVHIDVVDAAGNMISATPSGGWLQSSPTVPALGFCLGTRAQMTWLEDGLAATLTPGRRPRTTLSPSLGLRDGEPVLAFGTPGGDQQDQWQLCFWLAHTVGGLDLQAAIDAPAWHTTSFPSSFAPRSTEPGGLVVESRLGAATVDGLRRRGHVVADAGPWTLGRLCAVGRGPFLRAAADRRSGIGGAAAY